RAHDRDAVRPQRLSQQSRVLLLAERGARGRGAARAHLPHRRAGRAGQRAARRAQGRIRGHRRGAAPARELRGPTARSVSRGPGRGGAGPADARAHVHRLRGAGQARRELHAARGGRLAQGRGLRAAGRGVAAVKKFVLPVALFALIGLMLAYALAKLESGEYAPRYIPSPLVGKPLPAFALPTLADPERRVGPADLRGRPFLL